jgi:UDP-glucuronate 4-epimerase
VRYLVTGCAGFIGSHLAEALLEDGHSVLGIDCLNDNYARGQKLDNLRRASEWGRFEFVPLDLSRGDLREPVAECDTVLHLAAEPGVRPSWGRRFETYVRNNVLATHHLLEAVREEPGRRFVFASSSSVYGQAELLPTSEDVAPRPLSPYGITKLSGEQLCQAYSANFGVDVSILRYFAVYGPRQRPDMAFTRFCRAAVRGERITLYGDGEQARDFTFVSDVVTATRSAAAAAAPVRGPFNIGGGEQLSINAVLALLREISGGPIDVEHLPVQPGDVRRTAADSARAREALGFAPEVSITEGLEAQFEWVRSSEELPVAPSPPMA